MKNDAEKEKKRGRRDRAHRTKRVADARQGRIVAVRWHKKRRSEKRKKRERDRRGEREERKAEDPGADESER